MANSHSEWSALTDLIDRFCSRYPNHNTARQYRSELRALFRHVGVPHPAAPPDAAVNQWVALSVANNTRRNRLTRVCMFLRWCVRQGLVDPKVVEELTSRDNPLRSTPPLYGKLQGKFPARLLTYSEAYEVLLGVCDDSDVGRRDELILRLGLAGMRVAEIIHLRLRDLRLGPEPTIEWIGKKSRARKVAIGPALGRTTRRRVCARLSDFAPRKPALVT